MITEKEYENNHPFARRLAASIMANAGRNCFFIDGQYHTYAALACRVAAIRHLVGGLEDRYVGLVAHDDLATYASVLALWMEGKAYVPLHPLQPQARLDDIVRQVGLQTVLDSGTGAYYESVDILHTQNAVGEGEVPDLMPVSEEGEVAYMLFTSGSTGRPKGVPVTFDSVSAFVSAFFALGIDINSDDRCLQMFDLTFDLSVCSLLLPLLRGACVYTVKPGSIKWQEVSVLLEDHRLTLALMVPSVIHYLRPYMGELEVTSLRHSLFCGEALAADDIAAWQQLLPGCKMWNVYGPTEHTIFCTAYPIPAKGACEANGIVSIGRAMPGTATRIVGEEQREVARGEKGELCLAGRQLTPGYWNDEKKNSEAFFEADGQRWYRTGDICSEQADGNILYYGRMDSQVKIQGFRVELSEIEHVASRYFSLPTEAVAVAVADQSDNLCIHLTVENGGGEDNEELKKYLRQYLPAYMMPAGIHHIQPFPQNDNNKIDRKKIKEMIINSL